MAEVDETHKYKGLQLFPDRHPSFGELPYQKATWRQNADLIALTINVRYINRYEFTITKDTFSFSSVNVIFNNTLKFKFYDTVQAVSHEMVRRDVIVYFVKKDGLYWPKLTRDDGFVEVLPLSLIQSPVSEPISKNDKVFIPVGNEELYFEKLCPPPYRTRI